MRACCRQTSPENSNSLGRVLESKLNFLLPFVLRQPFSMFPVLDGHVWPLRGNDVRIGTRISKDDFLFQRGYGDEQWRPVWICSVVHHRHVHFPCDRFRIDVSEVLWSGEVRADLERGCSLLRRKQGYVMHS
jgi:hypothetical protein